jgi:hypothetical protein
MPRIAISLNRVSVKKSPRGLTTPVGKIIERKGSIAPILLIALFCLCLARPCLASPKQPPDSVITAVRQAASQRAKIPPSRLNLRSADARTWSDGCLGLAQSGEICTQSLVEGWRIILTDDQKTWIYRTDSTGRAIRLESPN